AGVSFLSAARAGTATTSSRPTQRAVRGIDMIFATPEGFSTSADRTASRPQPHGLPVATQHLLPWTQTAVILFHDRSDHNHNPRLASQWAAAKQVKSLHSCGRGDRLHSPYRTPSASAIRLSLAGASGSCGIALSP